MSHDSSTSSTCCSKCREFDDEVWSQCKSCVKAFGENQGVPVLHEGFKGGCDIRPSEDIFLIFACFDTVSIADWKLLIEKEADKVDRDANYPLAEKGPVSHLKRTGMFLS